jgi:pilus assembly protein Flp/PilA
MLTLTKKFLTDDSAATLVEYGLIIALVAVAAIAALTFLSGKIQTLFSTVGNDL